MIEPLKFDLNQKFGRLTIIGPSVSTNQGKKWLCLCECKNTKHMLASQLKNGKARSCGCIRKERFAKLTRKYETNPAVNLRIGHYRISAKKKSNEWSLTHNEASGLLTNNCHYCGSIPSMKMISGNFTALVNGIDRLDNLKGYTTENAVSCCSICNRAKSDLSQEEWTTWLDRISTFRSKEIY